MSQPFRVIPWNMDFLPAIKNVLDELTDGQPGRAVVVFPHSRPRRYLVDLYRRETTEPLLLPRMLTGQELRELCRAAWDQNNQPLHQAGKLDQVALLKQSVDLVAEHLPKSSPLKGLAREGGMARFFPWGTRLADLMEECLAQMVDAQDLRHAEGEVEPFAAALLGELRHIRSNYLTRLGGAGMSTQGLDAHVVAQRVRHNPSLPQFLRNRQLVLAGFVSLTRSEDMLFRYLWQQGATFCLHTDPGVVTGAGHWSCVDHARWLERWKAPTTLADIPDPDQNREPHLHFFAGYDLHSQLQELQKVLSSDQATMGDSETSLPEQDDTSPTSSAIGQAPGQAVVLPHSSLLMPTLHHLPRKDINISLGYPLERSLLARLTDTVFRVRESRRADGRVHWRPLLDLVRHPYVRMLQVMPAQEPADTGQAGVSLRPLLHRLERRIRNGTRLLHFPAMVSDMLDEELGDLDAPSGQEKNRDRISEAAGQLLEQVVETLVTSWDAVTNLRQTAERLAAMCDMLLRHGRHIWPRFPIDAECLFRLMQNVVPGLTGNAMADDILPVEALFAIARQSLADERVPFEADPLTGLQVLGMLETRLLRFDKVYLMDLTEDRLPGAPRHDPLLPDNLRGLLGLPDTKRRDILAAHTFHRLIAGAGEVYLFWQEGVESSGLLDAKKIRSRFVEEALWHREKALGKRLRPGEDPLRAATFPLSAPPRHDKTPVAKTPAIQARLDAMLAEPLSPTRLDAYMRCPARFFREQLCRIRPLEEVLEGDDPKRVGDLLHDVLRRAYEPYLGRRVRPGDIEPAHLAALFRDELHASDLRERLPAESWLMLEAAGPLRLKNFLKSQPDEFTLLEIERTHTAIIPVQGDSRILSGILDRVDRRPDGAIILDYKSGRPPKTPLPFWRDNVLWSSLQAWTPDRPDILPNVAMALPSLQLPCYLYLYTHDADNPDGQSTEIAENLDAAWVRLADAGQEAPLLGPKWSPEARREIIEHKIPALLHFVLDHMQNAPVLAPHPGPHCAWCPYANSCS